MTVVGEYVPSTNPAVAEQVHLYESTGGTEGGTMQGAPCVILTTKGRQSGKVRKTPLMRVEHQGVHAVVASKRGADVNPQWYFNLTGGAEVTIQDGDQVFELRAREVEGEEKAAWWVRAVEAWPDYDDYQANTARQIPVVVLEPQD